MSTKDKVLEILSSNAGKSVSGEKLAQACEVSRAAVWKAINSLRENGCNIEGTTNGGYILNDNKGLYSKAAIQLELKNDYPQFADSHLEFFNKIDSTNTYAKKLLSECGNLRNPDGKLTESGKMYNNSIYIAETQTAGRGRLGRTFVSPAKTGIYLSVVYAPEGGITNPAMLTAFSAVAVCRVIKKLFNINAQIKWINDIFVNGKKICGILTEGFTNFETGIIESAVIGIGLNIQDNPQVFSPELLKTAGSLLGNSNNSGSDSSFSLSKIAADIAGETLKILSETPQQLISEYKNLSFLIGTEITVHPVIGDDKSTYKAKAVDIDENAGLVVQLCDGTLKTLSSGEVSLHSDSI